MPPVTPLSRPIGFGIVGLGMIAEFHAQAIAGAAGARLVGAVSRDADKARAYVQRHGASFATNRLEELLARPEVDVVCITTPAGAHLEPALAAIAAGKHLVIEKPVEITPERCDRILEAADARGVKVAAIFQARFGEGARNVKAAVDAGRFGRMVLASAQVKWHRKPEYYSGYRGTLDLDGGGVLLNQAIHAIDLLLWFAGMPNHVYCRATRRVHERIAAEDTASATLQFASGALGSIEATTAAWPGWQRRIELCGENGSVSLEDDHVARWDFREAQPGDEAIRSAQDTAKLGSGASAPNAISFEGHRRQIEDLVAAIHGNRAVAIDGWEARRPVAVINALYASARSGLPVAL
ncbi:MAG TPA: Gfo/Idh/MocA family oxidoreductase [Opitutaceae bacterium]|nr:Gfo/Idh/MocA family oxidoreductase [Opitutaceae bacterium]